jgi:cell division septation protein DedD
MKKIPIELPKDSAVQPAQQDKKGDVRVENLSSSKAKETVTQRPQALPKKEPAAASSNLKLRYTLQIAAYPVKQMAEDEVKKMKKRGYAAFIASAELPGKGMWHRVRLGSFLNKAAAEKLQKTLHAKEGISPMIVIE